MNSQYFSPEVQATTSSGASSDPAFPYSISAVNVTSPAGGTTLEVEIVFSGSAGFGSTWPNIHVQAGTSSGVYTKAKNISTGSPSTKMYATLTGLTPLTKYYIGIRASDTAIATA